MVLADVIGSEGRLTAGVLLMLLNSGVVIGLGAVAYPVLKRHHPFTATAYLLTRGFEAALLAVGAVLLLTLVPLADELTASGDPSLAGLARVIQQASQHAYWVAMIGLSLGSLLFCRALSAPASSPARSPRGASAARAACHRRGPRAVRAQRRRAAGRTGRRVRGDGRGVCS